MSEGTARPPERLETARLRLRPPEPADAARMFERWARDPGVTRYLAWSPHRDVSETAQHVARCRAGWESGEEFVWLLETRAQGTLVGSIAARPLLHGVNIGYLLARDAWGNGYMTEAVDAITEWYLAQPDVYRVWAVCDLENTPSARVLERAGFQFEGVLRRFMPHPGAGPGPRDVRCYSRVR